MQAPKGLDHKCMRSMADKTACVFSSIEQPLAAAVGANGQQQERPVQASRSGPTPSQSTPAASVSFFGVHHSS